jgi:cell division protease FtsH
MVCQFGMSEKIGSAVFPQGEIHPFLGREISQEKKYSEHTAQLIDNEIMSLIEERRKMVEDLLKKHKDDLIKISDALLKEETLTNEQIDEILGEKKKTGRKRKKVAKDRKSEKKEAENEDREK